MDAQELESVVAGVFVGLGVFFLLLAYIAFVVLMHTEYGVWGAVGAVGGGAFAAAGGALGWVLR